MILLDNLHFLWGLA